MVNTSECDDKTLRVCGAAHPRLPLLLLLLPLSGLSPLFLLQAVLGFRCCINVLQLQVHRHVSPQPAPSPKGSQTASAAGFGRLEVSCLTVGIHSPVGLPAFGLFS